MPKQSSPRGSQIPTTQISSCTSSVGITIFGWKKSCWSLTPSPFSSDGWWITFFEVAFFLDLKIHLWNFISEKNMGKEQHLFGASTLLWMLKIEAHQRTKFIFWGGRSSSQALGKELKTLRPTQAIPTVFDRDNLGKFFFGILGDVIIISKHPNEIFRREAAKKWI